MHGGIAHVIGVANSDYRRVRKSAQITGFLALPVFHAESPLALFTAVSELAVYLVWITELSA